MKLATCNPEQVMSWRPCTPPYTQEYVEGLFRAKHRKRANALDILLDARIPDEDKLWLVLREELIPAKVLHSLACDFAARALLHEREAGREPDARSWAAIEMKRRWICDKATNGELAAACAAACDAASVAAYAARDAAYAAADAAARDAAYAAAYAASVAAYAARDAASDAARAAQVKHIIETLQKLESEEP